MQHPRDTELSSIPSKCCCACRLVMSLRCSCGKGRDYICRCRWPYRRGRSVDKRIQKVQEVIASGPSSEDERVSLEVPYCAPLHQENHMNRSLCCSASSTETEASSMQRKLAALREEREQLPYATSRRTSVAGQEKEADSSDSDSSIDSSSRSRNRSCRGPASLILSVWRGTVTNLARHPLMGGWFGAALMWVAQGCH